MARSSVRWVPAPPSASAGSTSTVVVLLGWWGANQRHVAKYAEMWRDAAPSSCAYSVVSATSDIFGDGRRDRWLRRIVAAVMAEMPPLPDSAPHVAVHLFSNGGGLLWSQLLRDAPSTPEYAAFLSRVQCVVYDSSPGHLGIVEGWRAVTAQLPRGVAVRAVAAVCFALPAAPLAAAAAAVYVAPPGSAARRRAVTVLLVLLIGSAVAWHQHRLKQAAYWRGIRESSLRIPELFVYSDDDTMIAAASIDKLVAQRRARGAAVSALRLTSSAHVAHLLHHPEQYAAAVRRLHAAAAAG